MSWTFQDQENYKDYLSSNGLDKLFTYKVSYFDLNRHYFSQSGVFFRDFTPDYPNPKDKKAIPLESILGEHTRRSLLLDQENLTRGCTTPRQRDFPKNKDNRSK